MSDGHQGATLDTLLFNAIIKPVIIAKMPSGEVELCHSNGHSVQVMTAAAC